MRAMVRVSVRRVPALRMALMIAMRMSEGRACRGRAEHGQYGGKCVFHVDSRWFEDAALSLLELNLWPHAPLIPAPGVNIKRSNYALDQQHDSQGTTDRRIPHRGRNSSHHWGLGHCFDPAHERDGASHVRARTAGRGIGR